MATADDEEDTETKLAILSSIFTKAPQDALLDILIRAEGRIPEAVDLFLDDTSSAGRTATFGPPAKRRKTSEEPNNEGGESDAVQRLKWTDSAEPARKVEITLPLLSLCGDSSVVGPTSNSASLPTRPNRRPDTLHSNPQYPTPANSNLTFNLPITRSAAVEGKSLPPFRESCADKEYVVSLRRSGGSVDGEGLYL
jgi:hypothetical protein